MNKQVQIPPDQVDNMKRFLEDLGISYFTCQCQDCKTTVFSTRGELVYRLRVYEGWRVWDNQDRRNLLLMCVDCATAKAEKEQHANGCFDR